jgi:hypothetical protein
VRHLESATPIHWEPATLACLAHAYAAAGDRARGLQVLDQLGRLANTRYVSRYHQALAWAGIGDLDQTFALLSCAGDERDPALMLLRTEPRFAALREDARYHALAQRLGFDRELASYV